MASGRNNIPPRRRRPLAAAVVALAVAIISVAGSAAASSHRARTTEVKASHVPMISQPTAILKVILAAARRIA